MMTHRPRPLLPSLLALGLLCASGCVEGKADDGLTRIAVIPKGTTHEFWKSVHAGAATAGSELDAEILWKGPLREDDRDEQIKVIEGFVARGVDAIVLAPLDEKALAPACRDAAAAGIPVVVIDSDLDWDGRTSYVATDNYVGGALGARELGRVMQGKGKAMLLRYVEGSASTMRREQGFLDTLAQEFPGIEIVSSNQRTGATVEGAYQTAENLLANYPDIEGVFCPCEPVVFGMLRALQDAGRAGAVRLVGFDATDKLIEGLRTGEIDALVVQDPRSMGYRGVAAALASLRGERVAPRIDTGCVVATRANLEDPRISALLFPDLSGLDD